MTFLLSKRVVVLGNETVENEPNNVAITRKNSVIQLQ